MKKVLLTGMTGFAGRHLAEKILADTDWEIYSLERLTARSAPLQSPRIHRVYHDFRAPLPDRLIEELKNVEDVIHIGAEVHGLRSLENPELFVQSNVTGTFNMLEAARKLSLKRFLYVSSAEVIGSAAAPYSWDENHTLCPSNPYAAAKGAGEMLCRSYSLSFGVPAIIVRTMNIFGEQQDTSKFIPATIKKILAGEVVTIHVGPNGSSGSRHWLYVGEFIKGLLHLLENSTVGEVYHIAGPEQTNQDIVYHLSLALHYPLHQKLVVPGRSHDMRYSIRDTKLYNEAYNSSIEQLNLDLEKTARAYKQHPEWLQ